MPHEFTRKNDSRILLPERLKMAKCFRCSATIVETNIGRLDDCPKCFAPLKVCLNCDFYDRSAYNECRESQADRVVDKDRSNFCDYFKLSSRNSGTGLSPAEEARKKAEALFKKKPDPAS